MKNSILRKLPYLILSVSLAAIGCKSDGFGNGGSFNSSNLQGNAGNGGGNNNGGGGGGGGGAITLCAVTFDYSGYSSEYPRLDQTFLLTTIFDRNELIESSNTCGFAAGNLFGFEFVVGRYVGTGDSSPSNETANGSQNINLFGAIVLGAPFSGEISKSSAESLSFSLEKAPAHTANDCLLVFTLIDGQIAPDPDSDRDPASLTNEEPSSYHVSGKLRVIVEHPTDVRTCAPGFAGQSLRQSATL